MAYSSVDLGLPPLLSKNGTPLELIFFCVCVIRLDYFYVNLVFITFFMSTVDILTETV